ncbi:tetratricopeptide repeat protein [Aestuariibacter halophilus]|uniref:Tetratricopeptide repeat protein n=2 Tax=Fluctibacter halophilus TaxID=226011 RepID=A0ABS8GC46_9ALTE|nr:CDC27 family protein [Aestuariibacter halophilus]MCC2618068.1 tetratricopeptide repeat protein [Aestuariibacter halophilus]
MMTYPAFLSLIAVLLTTTTVSVVLPSGQAFAQSEQQERKTRRTPALRAKVYDQLARAQALADEDKTDEAIVALDNVKEKAASMNSYELAMMYNFYGFIYYNIEDYNQAIAAFEQVVEQQPIPESFEQSTLFSLAQLHMMQGNYDKTIQFLERWEGLQKGDIPAKNLVLKAQAMYQKKDYQAASDYINKAIERVESDPEKGVAEENWYVLQRAVYYELKQPRKVTEVLVKLVKHFNQPQYWVQLGGMYGEIGEEEKQLAILESAYQQGFITSAGDIFNLAQLYYYHQVPYKAAALMEKAINDGVLEENLRNLRFLANSWQAAKEKTQAITTLRAAAQLSDDGELDAQLAQLYLNQDAHSEAIDAGLRALEKGGLRNPGITHLVLGMAYFNQGDYVDALDQLASAESFERSKAMAQQWRRYVETERTTQQQRGDLLSAASE